MTEMDAQAEPVGLGPETPEADAVEQAQADAEQLVPDPAELRDEVPEADAVEQAHGGLAEATPRGLRSIPDGVPEADALEQAYEVPFDDDYR